MNRPLHFLERSRKPIKIYLLNGILDGQSGGVRIIMVTISTFKKLALSFYEVTEQPHFEKTSFRVNKKIFATLDIKNNNAVLKFSEVDQSAFSAYDMAEIYPVNGAWGKQGWTIVNLKKISKERLLDALTTSYCTVAPKKLAEKYKQP